MKKLLYALLGLWLFGVQIAQGQELNQIGYGSKGYFVKLGWFQAPKLSNGPWVSAIYPTTPTTTTAFYYINGQGERIDFTVGSGGLTYIPGVGLTLSNNLLSLNQSPNSLGSITVNDLNRIINNPPITPLNVGTNLLIRSGDGTVGIVRWDDFITAVGVANSNLGVTPGGGSTTSALRRVAPVVNQSQPGQAGDYFWYQGKFHLNIEKVAGQNMWLRFSPDSVFSYNQIPTVIPAPALAYTGNPSPTSLGLSWTYSSPVNAFTLYASKSDTLHYAVVTSSIGAGTRSYTYTNADPGSTYYFKLAATTPSGVSPLSNTVSGTTAPADFTVWPNLKNVVVTQSGPSQIKIDWDITEPGGGYRFDITKTTVTNPSATSDEMYDYAVGGELGAVGHYSATVDGVSGTTARWLRYRRTSTSNDGKQPSNWGLYGPFAQSGSGIEINAPQIVSATNVTNTSLTLNLNLNNTNIQRVILYTSANNQISFDSKDIPIANTYNVSGLTAGKKYVFRYQVVKMDGSNEVYSPNSNNFEVTTTGTEAPTLCNYSESYSGGYVLTTRTFTATQTGNVYYMLDCGLIPDKLIVKKNGTTVSSPAAHSWRTQGSVAVNSGDVIEFTVDPRITGDQGTGWTLYTNCSTPYNVDTPLASFNYGNKDYPFITSVARSGSGTSVQYTINATSARATGAAITGYKVVRAIRSYRADEGWSSSNVVTRDQAGEVIYADEAYVVYVRDANGKVYGVAGITTGGSFTEDIPASQPVQIAVSNVTSTGATITVTNHPGGSVNYSWAVYQGIYNQGGIYSGYAGSNIPSTGSFNVSYSLTPGQTYNMYVTETSNADAKRNYVSFTVPASTNPPSNNQGTIKARAYSTSN